MSKISVIVPVYNVEKYLPKCIESIINQTYKDLEIILVDDGSTDSSGNICDMFGQKDSRIKIVHKENGGLSDARNTGLDVCTGEYIGFVDCDDYIAADMYEFLYNFLKTNNLDVSMCETYHVFESNIHVCRYFEPKFLNETNKIIEEIFANKYGGSAISVCNKLYKREVLEDVRFDKYKSYEDVFFSLKWIGKTKTFGRTHEGKYFYLQRECSITHQNKFSDVILDVINGYSKNLEIIKELYPKSIEVGEYRLWHSYRVAIEKILKCSDCNDHLDNIIEIQKRMRSNWFRILSNKYLKNKERIAYILLMININLYQFIKNMRNIESNKIFDKDS